MNKLLETPNRALLTDLLSNHIVKGKIVYGELKDGDKLTTVNGRELHVKAKNGTVSIGEITILPRETKISNGVMHLMDTVIM